MSGRWRIDPSKLEKHDHLLIETDDGRRLALNDPRRFGSLDLVRTDELAEWPPFKALGPEPLGSRRRGAEAAARRAHRGDQAAAARPADRRRASATSMCARRCIGPASTRAAPGGSISLDAAGAAGAGDPRRACRGDRGGRLDAARFRGPDGELGYFSKSSPVYDREGQPCACGGTVRRIVQGGRSTFYCPRCQRCQR